MKCLTSFKTVAAAGLLAIATFAAPVANAAPQYVLKVAVGCPPAAAVCQFYTWWMNDIEKKTDGRVKFQPYWGGSLVKSSETLGAVRDGVAHIGLLYTNEYPGQLPLAQLGALPFLTRDPHVLQLVMRDLFEEFPAFQNELKHAGVVSLANTPPGGTGVLSTKQPVLKLEDLKGRKMFTIGNAGETVRMAGVNPVSLAWSESFEALQRGVVDSAVMYPLSLKVNRFYEVADHFTWIGETGGLGNNNIYTVINQRYWDRLPEDIKTVFRTSMREGEDFWARLFQSIVGEAVKLNASGDMAFHTLPEADVAKWREAMGNPLAKWAEQNRKHGDTDAIIKRYVELEAKYEAQVKAQGYPKAAD